MRENPEFCGLYDGEEKNFQYLPLWRPIEVG